MKIFIKNVKVTYIFNILALLIIIATVFMYNEFNKTKETIKDTNIESNIEYVDDISDNILEFISAEIGDEHLVAFLGKSEVTRLKLESYLKIFTTKRYRYIYLIDKENMDSGSFRIFQFSEKVFFD